MENLPEILQPDSPLLWAILIWSIAWKGVALWNAARRGQLGWYVSLLIINTLGILEIIYLLGFRKKS